MVLFHIYLGSKIKIQKYRYEFCINLPQSKGVNFMASTKELRIFSIFMYTKQFNKSNQGKLPICKNNTTFWKTLKQFTFTT